MNLFDKMIHVYVFPFNKSSSVSLCFCLFFFFVRTRTSVFLMHVWLLLSNFAYGNGSIPVCFFTCSKTVQWLPETLALFQILRNIQVQLPGTQWFIQSKFANNASYILIAGSPFRRRAGAVEQPLGAEDEEGSGQHRRQALPVRDVRATVHGEAKFEDASLDATSQLRTTDGAKRVGGGWPVSSSSVLRVLRKELRAKRQAVTSFAQHTRRECAEKEKGGGRG